jgi:hypothetical protein
MQLPHGVNRTFNHLVDWHVRVVDRQSVPCMLSQAPYRAIDLIGESLNSNARHSRVGRHHRAACQATCVLHYALGSPTNVVHPASTNSTDGLVALAPAQLVGQLSIS